MPKRLYIVLPLLVVIGLSSDINNQELIQIGGVEFQVLENGSSQFHYIWLHGDERTALMLINEHIKTHPGTAFLINNEEREVRVRGLLLDPNRMFSRYGAEKNLQKMNANYSRAELEKILDHLDRDLEPFFGRIKPPENGLLISVHNNLRGYSIEDELSQSDDISIKNDGHPDHHDFYIWTDPYDFKILSQSPYNVVLQNGQSGNDDGSLSRLAARKNVRFINIETRLGYLSVQRKMLKYVVEHLK